MNSPQEPRDLKLVEMFEAFAGPPVPTLRGASGRDGRRRRVAVSVVAAVAVVGAIATAPAVGWPSHVLDLFRGGTPVDPSSLSDQDLFALGGITTGRPVSAPRDESLRRLGATRIREIAERGGRSYYVVDKADGGRCFAVGYAASSDRLGQISCPQSPAFPSPSRPILDLAVYHGAPGTTLPLEGSPCCLWRLEGFAADGVASVGVETSDGRVVATTDVVDNVYLRTDDLPSEPVRAIVAFDSGGARLYTECLARDGCEHR